MSDAPQEEAERMLENLVDINPHPVQEPHEMDIEEEENNARDYAD